MSELSIPEKAGRVAVSVEFAWQHPEFTYFKFDKEADDLGLDPWRIIDCDLDKLTQEPGYIFFGRVVQRGHIIYMQPPRVRK